MSIRMTSQVVLVRLVNREAGSDPRLRFLHESSSRAAPYYNSVQLQLQEQAPRNCSLLYSVDFLPLCNCYPKESSGIPLIS
jgi:hypothetical protein